MIVVVMQVEKGRAMQIANKSVLKVSMKVNQNTPKTSRIVLLDSENLTGTFDFHCVDFTLHDS